MQIRPFQSGDEHRVIRLWADCGLIAPQNNPVRNIDRKQRVNPEWFLAGELGGDLIATCMAGYEGHRGWIDYLAIAPPFQKRGYGQKIMQAAERLLKDAGYPKVKVQVASTNRAVVEFCKSIGYRVEERVSLGKRFKQDELY